MTRIHDDGFTVVELAVASALSMATLGIVLAIMWTALRTTTAAQQESDNLEQAQLAMNRIERDARGATEVNICDADGLCVGLFAQLGDGSVERIRYRVVGTTLLRDRGCTNDTYADCPDGSEELLDRVQNGTVNEAVFECAVPGRVELRIVLLVEPLQTIVGQGGGTVRLSTSTVVRPVDPDVGCLP